MCKINFTFTNICFQLFGVLSPLGFVFGIIKQAEDEASKTMAAFLLGKVNLHVQLQYYKTQRLREAICLIVMLCVNSIQKYSCIFKVLCMQMSRFGAVMRHKPVPQ